MSNIREMIKDKWEKRRVQRVVDYYNKKQGTHIKILGKSITIYPELKGQLNWDWVCDDKQTKEEIAIEVKRITDQQKEQEYNVIWQALMEVQKSINDARILQGTYLLSSQIHLNKTLIFKEKGDKTEFKDTVFQIIYESARSMKQGEEKLLTPLIRQKLSYQLPDFISIILYKISDKGSKIGKGFGISGFTSIKFDANELNEFQELVSYANLQLGKSGVKKTILVIIEEGFRHKDPSAITEAFSRIKPEYYSKISQVYFVQGKEVTEIKPHNPS